MIIDGINHIVDHLFICFIFILWCNLSKGFYLFLYLFGVFDLTRIVKCVFCDRVLHVLIEIFERFLYSFFINNKKYIK